MALPAGWPKDRPLALSISVMLEGWTDDSAPGIGPMGNPLRAGVLDLQARSWAEYGPKVGAWRILEALARQKVRAVFYVSGILAERHPDLMKAIVAAGHVVA
ncbi:MAG TPA: polysaccharide deacetylase family protein, partial [Reyranella sp.]|nr:polysaccharide deacetylase family protein [Reyranella sp.]